MLRCFIKGTKLLAHSVSYFNPYTLIKFSSCLEILPWARARLDPIARHGKWKQAVAREKSDAVGEEEERRGERNVGTEVGNLENGPPGRDRRSYPRAANLHSIIRCNQIDSPRYGTTGGSFYRGKLSLRTTLLHYFWWFVLRTER